MQTERAKIVVLTRNAANDSVLTVMLSDITRDSTGVYSYPENSLHSGANIELAIVDITQLPNLDLATGIISIGEPPTSSVKTISNKELAIRLSEELTARKSRVEHSIQYLTELTRQLSLYGTFSQTVEEIPNSLHLTHEIPLGGERTTVDAPVTFPNISGTFTVPANEMLHIPPSAFSTEFSSDIANFGNDSDGVWLNLTATGTAKYFNGTAWLVDTITINGVEYLPGPYVSLAYSERGGGGSYIVLYKSPTEPLTITEMNAVLASVGAGNTVDISFNKVFTSYFAVTANSTGTIFGTPVAYTSDTDKGRVARTLVGILEDDNCATADSTGPIYYKESSGIGANTFHTITVCGSATQAFGSPFGDHRMTEIVYKKSGAYRKFTYTGGADDNPSTVAGVRALYTEDGGTETVLTPVQNLIYDTKIINVSTNQHNVLVVPVPRQDDETDYQVKFVEGRPSEREDYSDLDFRSATAGEAFITTIPNRSNHKFIEYLRNNYFIENQRQRMLWTFTNGSESRIPTHISIGIPGIIADNQSLTFLSVESGTRFNTSLHDVRSDAMDFYTSGFATAEVRRRFGIFFEETLESTPVALVASGIEIPLTFQTLGGLIGFFTDNLDQDFTKAELDESTWNIKLEDGTYLFNTQGGPPVVTEHALSKFNHNGLAQGFTRYTTVDTFGDKTEAELEAQTYNIKYSNGTWESHTIEIVGEEIEFFPLNNWVHIDTNSPIFKYFASELKFPLNLTGTLTLEKRERTPRQSRFAGYTDGIPEVSFLANLADAFNTIIYRGRALVHLTKPQGPFNAADQGHTLTFGDTNPGSTSGYYGWARAALADFTTGAVGTLQGEYPDELDAILVEKQERAYVYIIGSNTLLINSFLAFISTDKSYTLESSVQGSGSVQFKRVVDEDGNFMSADDLDGVMAGDTKKIAIARTNDRFIGAVDPAFPIGDYRVKEDRSAWERVWINNFEPYTKEEVEARRTVVVSEVLDSDHNIGNTLANVISVNITPKSASSKFKVSIEASGTRRDITDPNPDAVSSGGFTINIRRIIGSTSTDLGIESSYFSSTNSAVLIHTETALSKNRFDSPNTASQITYQLLSRRHFLTNDQGTIISPEMKLTTGSIIVEEIP